MAQIAIWKKQEKHGSSGDSIMKITLNLKDFESTDALANAMQDLAEQLRVKSAKQPKQAEKKVASVAAPVPQQPEKIITHTGRQPTEKAILTRKAVVNLAKMQWRPDGFTANDLSAYLGVDRMSAMNALIYWSEEGKHPSPLVYRAGTQENPGKGKDPVLWKWVSHEEAANKPMEGEFIPAKRQRKAK